MTTAFNATKDQIGRYVADASTGGYPEIGLYLMRLSEADATLADRDTLADIWAAAGSVNLEANFTNYVVKLLASPTRTVDDVNNRVLLGGAAVGVGLAITYTAAGGATNNTLVKALWCYIPTSGAATSLILPLMATNVSASTDGNDLVLTLNTDGFARVL